MGVCHTCVHIRGHMYKALRQTIQRWHALLAAPVQVLRNHGSAALEMCQVCIHVYMHMDMDMCTCVYVHVPSQSVVSGGARVCVVTHVSSMSVLVCINPDSHKSAMYAHATHTHTQMSCGKCHVCR